MRKAETKKESDLILEIEELESRFGGSMQIIYAIALQIIRFADSPTLVIQEAEKIRTHIDKGKSE